MRTLFNTLTKFLVATGILATPEQAAKLNKIDDELSAEERALPRLEAR